MRPRPHQLLRVVSRSSKRIEPRWGCRWRTGPSRRRHRLYRRHRRRPCAYQAAVGSFQSNFPSLPLPLTTATLSSHSRGLKRFRSPSPPATAEVHQPVSIVVPHVPFVDASDDDSALRACIKVPHADCQRMAVEGVRFLATTFPLTSWQSNGNSSSNGSHASSTRRSPLPDSVEGVAFAPMRSALLTHLAHQYPSELGILLYRVCQHSLYVHAYGWHAYQIGFTHPPSVPLVRAALAECTAHTRQQKAAKQAKAERLQQTTKRANNVRPRVREKVEKSATRMAIENAAPSLGRRSLNDEIGASAHLTVDGAPLIDDRAVASAIRVA
jgi:hypothetical protein